MSGSAGRPPDASRRLVMAAARSGGKSAAPQSALTPIPMMTLGSAVPRPSDSPRTPPSLRRTPASASSITRSFGHFNRIRPTRRPTASSAASAIARLTVAASRQVRSGESQPGRKPSEHMAEVPGGATHVRPRRPRPAVCSRVAAKQTSGVPPSSQARTMSWVEATCSNRSCRARNAPGRPAFSAGLSRPRQMPRRPSRAWRVRRQRGAP